MLKSHGQGPVPYYDIADITASISDWLCWIATIRAIKSGRTSVYARYRFVFDRLKRSLGRFVAGLSSLTHIGRPHVLSGVEFNVFISLWRPRKTQLFNPPPSVLLLNR